MYQLNFLMSRHALADLPPNMPIDILLALPPYVTDPADPGSLFNLPGAINDLMGSQGWETATAVLRPFIWAPQWTDAQLYEFASSSFGQTKHQFPKLDPRALRAPWREYEIIHFVGDLVTRDEIPGVVTTKAPLSESSFGVIRNGLRAANTRLLILQNPSSPDSTPPDLYYSAAKRLAEALIADGGPAVLVISEAENSDVVNQYLANFYANIVHNQPLPEAASPDTNIDRRISSSLFIGEGGEELLSFSRLRDVLYERVQAARQSVEPLTRMSYRKTLDKMIPYLPSQQVQDLEERVASLENEFSDRASAVLEKTRTMREELDFSHETGGAIPLGHTTRAMRSIDKEVANLNVLYPQTLEELKTELNAQAQSAPRVLNAGFADPSKGVVLEPRQPLVAGQEYDLLVDIGPKWSRVKSLVTGSENFPESALPPDEDGYPIHAVFVSNDTDPKFFSDWLYVPRQTGRSFPYDIVEKQKAKESGPVAFRLKAPLLSDTKEITAQLHGRLCLYYENNLLQSARVQASVARSAEVSLEIDNVIDVDYVLSGSVQRLDQYATRKLKFAKDDISREHPIAVNLTLNDDGKEHRILVRQHDELPSAAPANNAPVGWTPFDADAGRQALEDAREDLKSCFYLRDESTGEPVLDGNGEPIIGISEDANPAQNNRKTKKQFLWDLLILARLGRKLFNKAFNDVRPEGKWSTNAEWTNSLRQKLETSSIIQVSRTGPANYVFPWTLVYQYPLPGPSARIQFCKVTQEWDESGDRTKQPEKSCPWRAEPWHAENVICPYGFWGLNHIIEQPIPALRKLADGKYALQDATDKIVMGPLNLDLSVSVTHDLSPTAVDQHLKRLGSIPPYQLRPPHPADDTDKVRSMLKAATLVYFLCHGEYDTNKKEPYLSIGLRDGNDLHRIYPNTLHDWADAADLTAWGTQRPLIFINGCHTANLTPGEVLNFVTAFGFAGASGVIGTEVSVLANVAIEMAELLFGKIAADMPVGQAMYQTRWELANKGNLLGLAYTLFCLANLHVARN